MMGRIVGVDVFKGPAAIKYGPQTVGGAINLLTRFVPRKTAVGADLATGMYGTTNAHLYAGHGDELYGLLLEGTYQHSDGFKHLPIQKPTGFDRGELVLKASANTPLGGRFAHQWDVKAGVSFEVSHETYLGLSDADFARDPYQRYAASQNDLMRNVRSQVQASYTLLAGETWEFSLRAYRNDLSRQWTKVNGVEGGPLLNDVFAAPNTVQNRLYLSVLRGDTDSTATDRVLIGTNDRRFASQGVQATMIAHPVIGPVKQEIELSTRFHEDQADRVQDEYAYRMVAGQPVLDDPNRRINLNSLARAFAWASYVQDQLTWRRLQIVPGIRVEYIHTDYRDRQADTFVQADSVAVLPGIGASYAIIDELSVLAGVHRGFSPKAPGQQGAVLPEYSINYEAGARAQWQGLKAEAIAFVNDYSNLTGDCEQCVANLVSQQFNGGAVLVYGMEAAAKYAGSVGRWQLRAQASYTLTLSQFRSEFYSENPQWGQVRMGDRLPYVPEHQASATAGFGMASWGFDATVRFNGEMRDVPGQGPIAPLVKIPAYAFGDLAAFYVLPHGVRLTATLQNFTNSTYMASRRPFGARPGAPILFLAGMRYTF
jgi:Fe(3+) dicitrate transport protein